MRSSTILLCCLLLILVALSGCAQWPEPGAAAPSTPAQANLGQESVHRAESQVGAPYIYGGDTPQGFDCSGLVEYVYGQAGVHLPRTAEGQYNKTPRVTRGAIQPGDILFFSSDSGNLMHVGIYIGSHWFVHAPDSGKSVSSARLDSEYWKGHYLGAGRPGG
ncbi:MAG: C40 family peptidase [Gammaproteobacteria bacterium]